MDSAGAAFVAGRRGSGPQHISLWQLDVTGNAKWGLTTGYTFDEYNEAGWKVAVDAQGKPVFASNSHNGNGFIPTQADFGSGPVDGRFFIARPGDWAVGFTDVILPIQEPAIDLALAPSGEIVIAGYVDAPSNFGGGFLMGIVVVKMCS